MNRLGCCFSVLALSAVSAFAVDGVTLINQATVMAAGGFPYVISQPGSYKLSGTLTAASIAVGSCPVTGILPSFPFACAILITAPNVTLDLAGFTIVTPVIKGDYYNDTIDTGIVATATNVAIQNGLVTSSVGLVVTASNASIQNMRLTGRGTLSGFYAGTGARFLLGDHLIVPGGMAIATDLCPFIITNSISSVYATPIASGSCPN